MNKYAEAVKKGGDYWANYLESDLMRANTRTGIFADSALFDKMTVAASAKGSKMSKVNGGGYTDTMAGTFSEYVDFCV